MCEMKNFKLHKLRIIKKYLICIMGIRRYRMEVVLGAKSNPHQRVPAIIAVNLFSDVDNICEGFISIWQAEIIGIKHSMVYAGLLERGVSCPFS
jgi:hypothetical protein